MKRPKYRGRKYHAVLRKLKDLEIYSPAKIADFAGEIGFIENESSEEGKLVRQRIRVSMTQFAQMHQFPKNGDGYISYKNQRPIPGWLGKRWKAPLTKD